MTASEWMDIAATIRDRWPHATLPTETLSRWGQDLVDLPADHVGAAIEVLYREGREYAPHAGLIRHKLAELMLDVPDWGEALRQLRSIERTPIERAIDVSGPDDDEPRIEYVRPRDVVLRESHPLVLSFREHLDQNELGLLVGPDPHGSDEARARTKWEAFARRAHEIVNFKGIPDGGLAKLRRVQGPGELRPAGSAIRQVVAELEQGAEAA